MARKRAAPNQSPEDGDENAQTERKSKRPANGYSSQSGKSQTSKNNGGGGGGGGGGISAEQRAIYERELHHEAESTADVDGVELGNRVIGRRVHFEAGQIRSIYVENFMCHRKFSQPFYPGLNFIIGKNGSGKSAIAAAIQLCLGATARSTGRGANMSNLVREGSTSPAIIQVKLLNTGPDAYKPEVYGDHIIIERKITRGTGVGGYSLKSSAGEEISTQKEELEKILRIFNIFVDNPCCVLTQDESKKFINGKDEDKYKFFLKATGLHTLKEDLLEIFNDIAQAEKILENHDEHLQQEKERLQELRDEYERMVRLGTLQESIDMLKEKALWRTALDKEEALSEAQAVEKDKIAELAALQSSDESHSTRSKALEDGLNEANNTAKDLAAQSNVIAKIISEKLPEQHRKESDVNACKKRTLYHREQLRSLEERRANVERDIVAAKDTARASANNDLVRRLLNEEQHCCELGDELLRRKEQLQQDLLTREDLQRKNESIKRELDQAIRRLEHELVQDRAQLARTDSDGMSRVALLGPKIVEVTRAVAAARQRGEFRGEVLGPLGALVTVNEGFAEFAGQLERSIGSMLSAFVVSNAHDRDRVMRLTRDEHSAVTVITQPACARYKVPVEVPFERPPFILAMEALHISHDLLFNCLVDQVSIHRTALGKRAVLSNLIEGSGGQQRFKWQLQAFIDENGSLIRLVNGNKSDEVNRFPIRNILIADSASARQRLQQDIQEKEAQLRRYKEDMREIEHALQDHKREWTMLRHQLSQCENDLRQQRQQLRSVQQQLQEQQAVVDPDLTAMEAEKLDLDAEIDRTKAAIDQSDLDRKVANDVLEAFRKELEGVREQQRQCEKRLEAVGQQLQDLYTEEKRLKNARLDYQRSVSRLEEMVNRAQQASQLARETYLEHHQRATEQTRQRLGPAWDGTPPPLSPDDTVKKLESERRRLEAELAQARKDVTQRSETVEQAKQHLEQAMSEYQLAEERAQRVKDNLALLRSNKKERRKEWTRALKESADRTAKNFDCYVAEKYSRGEISFDHEEGVMRVFYQVDADDKSSECKDVRNLSGGERSYVTFSLLLALGHVIESPFRLMDEYDVFMDEPTRKLTLDLLVSYSRKPNQRQRQFIILTPHSLGSLCTSDRVHVSRMPEPQRLSAHGPQQQTLA